MRDQCGAKYLQQKQQQAKCCMIHIKTLPLLFRKVMRYINVCEKYRI